MDGLMAVYGLEGRARQEFERVVVDEFHFAPRPDAEGFGDGHVFDLGGVRVEAVHLPGHTRGHSGFRIGEVFFLSDIDLTGFGPYYGDVWSDLEDFEESLDKVRDEEAEFYVTFHHKGIIEGRAALDRRDGRSPLHLPSARRGTVPGVGGTPQRRDARAADAPAWRGRRGRPRPVPAGLIVASR
jgi:glyoxylase-like metal-dependent hydrolase (beta-lactamase superfamily II)